MTQQRRKTLALRSHLQRELLRRKAERETVENYIQTPFHKTKGTSHGCNVIEERIEHLRARVAHAERLGAVAAIRILEHFMRQHQIRVHDLFALVDTDGSGAIDREELRVILEKTSNLDLEPHDIEALFQFLDTSGDGNIEAQELEVGLSPSAAHIPVRPNHWPAPCAFPHSRMRSGSTDDTSGSAE